jgi:hypothetical protein
VAAVGHSSVIRVLLGEEARRRRVARQLPGAPTPPIAGILASDAAEPAAVLRFCPLALDAASAVDAQFDGFGHDNSPDGVAGASPSSLIVADALGLRALALPIISNPQALPLLAIRRLAPAVEAFASVGIGAGVTAARADQAPDRRQLAGLAKPPAALPLGVGGIAAHQAARAAQAAFRLVGSLIESIMAVIQGVGTVGAWGPG